MEPADQILDLLVRNHPADEGDVRPLVVELAGREPVRLAVEMREVRHDRQHRRPREAEGLEILAVELGVARREITAVGAGWRCAASAKRLTRQSPMHADEVFLRRDVVIDERHPIGKRVCRPRRLRAQREVVKQKVVGIAEVDQFAIIAGLRFEPIVSRFDEDVRLVSGGAKDALNAEHLMADRVAVPQRREHLVDPDHARLRLDSYDGIAGPVGSRASTSPAGGRSWRRRSNQPGSGSAAGGGGSLASRAKTSRYFRSITGQSY